MVKPYYQDSHCTIYHGDCREILPQLEPVDLVLTDPPYRQSTSGGGIVDKRDKFTELINSNLNNFEPKEYIELALSKTRGSHGYFFCSKNLLSDYINIFESRQLNWNILVMHKNNPVPCKNNTYLTDIEFIMFCRGKGTCFFDNGLDYYFYKKVKSVNVKPSGYNHPTVKPIEVISQLVRVSSCLGQTILDPFMGSGTTLRAAKDLNRKAIGIEIEEKYCEIAVERLRQEVLAL